MNNLGKFNISHIDGRQHDSTAQYGHQTKCAPRLFRTIPYFSTNFIDFIDNIGIRF